MGCRSRNLFKICSNSNLKFELDYHKEYRYISIDSSRLGAVLFPL